MTPGVTQQFQQLPSPWASRGRVCGVGRVEMDNVERGILAVGVVAAGVAIWVLVATGLADRERYWRDMAACQASGRAEWECRAMLRSGHTTLLPMPVVVPR